MKKWLKCVLSTAQRCTHKKHELYFLVAGQRRYFVGHTIYDAYPGNLVIIPKTELHKTTSSTAKGYDRYVVYFSDEDVTDLQQSQKSAIEWG